MLTKVLFGLLLAQSPGINAINRLSTMAQSAPLVQRILASSCTVASHAGQIIRDVMAGGELGIVDKGVNDLQTEADRSAQCFIISNLAKEFPGITIIGEEGDTQCGMANDNVLKSDPEVLKKTCPDKYTNVKPEEVVVWVDPLDGTSEYTKGLLDHVTVLIGLAVNGRAIGGVIHQPYYNYKKNGTDSLGRTLWGLVGMGVGGFTPIDPPKDKFVVTTTRSHNSELVMRSLEALKPDEVLRVGGAGHKVLMVLEGNAHAYVYASKGCKRWDTCAPEGILEAAGGFLTDVFGHHYDYNKNTEFNNVRGIVASRTMDHSALLAKLPQDVLDAFPKH